MSMSLLSFSGLSRRSFLRKSGAAAGASAVVISTNTGTVLADDDDDGDGDDDGDEDDAGRGPDYEVRLDRFRVIREYDYDHDAEQWTITFDSEEPGQVSLTATGQWSEGHVTGTIVQDRVSRGEQSVTIDAPIINGESQVVISSSESIEEERFVGLSTDQRGTNPFGQAGATAGWLGSAGITAGMIAVAFRRRLKGGSGGPESAWGD